MTRELILKITCVRCQADIPPGDPAYDVPVRLSFERRQGELDLCTTCRADLADLLQPYLDNLEVVPASGPRHQANDGRIAAMQCPRCQRRLVGGSTPLRKHSQMVHGLSREQAEKEIPLGKVGVPYLKQFPNLASLVVEYD